METVKILSTFLKENMFSKLDNWNKFQLILGITTLLFVTEFNFLTFKNKFLIDFLMVATKPPSEKTL